MRDAAGDSAHRVDLLLALQVLLEHPMIRDVQCEADNAHDLPVHAERLEPDFGNAAAQLALAVDRLPGEREQVIGDRLELGIVGVEVLVEVEADDGVELRMEAQQAEAVAVGGRDPQVTVDDPERRGNPRQAELAGLVDGRRLEWDRPVGHHAQAFSPLSQLMLGLHGSEEFDECQSSADTVVNRQPFRNVPRSPRSGAPRRASLRRRTPHLSASMPRLPGRDAQLFRAHGLPPPRSGDRPAR